MDPNKLVELLTTPKAEAKGTLIAMYSEAISASADLMNNALEHDKVLVVGREAQKIKEAADMIRQLLAS